MLFCEVPSGLTKSIARKLPELGWEYHESTGAMSSHWFYFINLIRVCRLNVAWLSWMQYTLRCWLFGCQSPVSHLIICLKVWSLLSCLTLVMFLSFITPFSGLKRNEWSKKLQEWITQQPNATKRRKENASSDDELQNLKRWQTKLENWASHQERDDAVTANASSTSSKH